MPDRNPALAVLLDRQLTVTGHGIDVDELGERLSGLDPSLHVRIVDGLESGPETLGQVVAASGAGRVVVASPSECVRAHDVQQAARDAGIDQFGILPVKLGTLSCRVADPEDRMDHAVLSLLGMVTRARAYQGVRQHNLRPSRPPLGRLASLFSLPELEYHPSPSVRRDRCRAANGCQECVNGCPHNALRIIDGQVRLRKQDCTSCGICLTACPNDAINFPSVMPAEIHAQMSSLLDEHIDGPDARGILFVCPNTMRNLAVRDFDLSSGWLPVEVPCLGMLTPQWLLAPLRLGAGAVGLVPCINDCRSGQIDQLRERVSYCQALLREAWDMPEAVQIAPASDAGVRAFLADDVQFPGFAFEDEPDCAFRYDARVEVILDVAAADGAGLDWAVAHPASPFADVQVTDGCTLCGSCAAACPADALQIGGDTPAKVALTFDSRRCITCLRCMPACPERNVLHVNHATNLALLDRGRTTLHYDKVNLCERCGEPISTDKMLERIAELLGEQHAPTLNVIRRLCTNCRGIPG